jgi:hypothetical protein
MMAVVFS